MPNPDALSLSAAIAQALYAAREDEKTPLAIIMNPATRHVLERAEVGTWWGGGGQHRLFGLPVEIVTKAAGWMVRVR